ncbi:hypothetical protein NPIL_654321 [Nephila pilipes]|uniref:Uncharacterized protein n=1 Tax=Nephila pilipes TaxID=299642 RepID=A0A8X6NET1_NEPPI|nr:hypothetical protein NPIL_654321 [Nephila pilipes]
MTTYGNQPIKCIQFRGLMENFRALRLPKISFPPLTMGLLLSCFRKKINTYGASYGRKDGRQDIEGNNEHEDISKDSSLRNYLKFEPRE